VSPGNSYKESFLNFIKRFYPRTILGADTSEEAIDGLLGKIHSYRSQYAHGGKDIPVASLVADRHGLVWVRYFDDGREELAPSISWFELSSKPPSWRSSEVKAQGHRRPENAKS
jgi:hypothetical protein